MESFLLIITMIVTYIMVTQLLHRNVCFYDFAVQGYDLKIKYNGVYYYFMVDTNCVWLSDETFSSMKKKFENGNDVLMNFLIDGKPLYQLVDKLEDYEPM